MTIRTCTFDLTGVPNINVRVAMVPDDVCICPVAERCFQNRGHLHGGREGDCVSSWPGSTGAQP